MASRPAALPRPGIRANGQRGYPVDFRDNPAGGESSRCCLYID